MYICNLKQNDMNKKTFYFMCGLNFGLFLCKITTIQMVGVNVPSNGFIATMLILTCILSFTILTNLYIFLFVFSVVIECIGRIGMGNFEWYHPICLIICTSSLYYKTFVETKVTTIFVDYGDITIFPPKFIE